MSGVPAGFAEFKVSEGTRTPGQILAHLGDLLDWALSQAKGKQVWRNAETLPWEQGVERFFASLKAFDDYLATDLPMGDSPEKIFQGAIADALTHVGQIAMLRRMAGGPIRGENYYRAEIAAGRVGAEQAAPVREFD